MATIADQIRRDWMENDRKRDAGLTTPADVERFDSLRYGPCPGMNLLDVYRPKGVEGTLPVIVNVHGGGWVYGDKELYQFYCMSLAQRGFAVVNFTYRLAPEAKFPAPLEDTNAVITWMFAHQDEYGLDMAHVFMVGDSAGGHLLALYASLCTNPDYAKNFSFAPPQGFKPTAVGLNCGAYVPAVKGQVSILGASQDHELMALFLPDGGTPEEGELINATHHVTKDYPPVFLMTSLGDFCRPHAPLMEKALKAHGVSYVYKTYGTSEEPLDHVFHCNLRIPMGSVCNDDECDYFRSFIKD